MILPQRKSDCRLMRGKRSRKCTQIPCIGGSRRAARHDGRGLRAVGRRRHHRPERPRRPWPATSGCSASSAPASRSTSMAACESSKWCVVAFDGGQGWVYSDYLTGDFGGTQVVLTERPAEFRRHRPAADVEAATGCHRRRRRGDRRHRRRPVGAVGGGGGRRDRRDRSTGAASARMSPPISSSPFISTAKSSSAPAFPKL